jgi:hypothetical protein
MQKFFYALFVFCLLFLINACNKAGIGNTEPVIVLPEEQMINIMTDAQLLEAGLNHKRNIGQSTTELKSLWYDELFKHYQITNGIFEDNLNYYAEDPAKMEGILEEVLARLSQMQSEVNAEKDSTATVNE